MKKTFSSGDRAELTLLEDLLAKAGLHCVTRNRVLYERLLRRVRYALGQSSEEAPEDLIPDLQPLEDAVKAYVKKWQDVCGVGYVDLQMKGCDTIYGYDMNADSQVCEEHRVVAVRVREEIEVILQPILHGYDVTFTPEDLADDENWQVLRYADGDYRATLMNIAESVRQYTFDRILATVLWKDGDTSEDYVVKLTREVEADDEEIGYYADGMKEVLELMKPGNHADFQILSWKV